MSDDQSDQISGEKYGIRWSIDSENVQKLADRGIDAIAEMDRAIESFKQSERKSDER